MQQLICEACGGTFESRRRARFCGDTCRKRTARRAATGWLERECRCGAPLPAGQRKWCSARCRTLFNQRDFMARNPHYYRGRGYGPVRERANKLRSTFGITPEEYDALLAAQGGGCALCGTTRDVDRRLAVDHDHDCCPGMRSCGRCVRGLLCGLCNKGLGQFGSSPERLRKAADYLEVAAMERHINVTYQEERIHDEANC